MKSSMVLKSGVIALLTALAIFFSPIGEDHKVEASTVNSMELLTKSKEFIGVKYRYGGTSTAGFDCSGYVRHVFSQLGISLPRSSASMYATGTAVKKSDLAVGDLVFFNTSGRGISHVGVYIGGNKFIHSMTGKGVTITDINDRWYWAAVT